ncbi:MAG: Gfo/Idh/MocA family oxidoreductase [Vicinamibacterales bacterium]
MRILIAGLGAIGQRHARNLRALRGGDLELLAFRTRRLPHVVTESLQSDDTRDVEAELGITVYDNLDEALGARPDAVFICTPSSRHLDIAERAAGAGCHLFIEKPVSHTLDGLDRLRELVESRRLAVLVGCQWRFHPAIKWLRDVLREGTLGPLVRVAMDYGEYLPDWHPYEDYRASYAARAELGGGVVLTQIHDYDLAWSLFGPPRTITAAGGHLSDLEIDVEDTVEAQLDGGSVPVTIRQSFATRPPRRTISVEGDAGSVMLDLLGGTISSHPRIVAAGAFAGYARNQMFVDEADHFLACVDGRASSLVPLDEGIAVLRLALAVRDAMRTKGVVEFA